MNDDEHWYCSAYWQFNELLYKLKENTATPEECIYKQEQIVMTQSCDELTLEDAIDNGFTEYKDEVDYLKDSASEKASDAVVYLGCCFILAIFVFSFLSLFVIKGCK